MRRLARLGEIMLYSGYVLGALAWAAFAASFFWQVLLRPILTGLR